MKSWCRRVLPPEQYVACALFAFLVAVGMGLWPEAVYPGTIRFPFHNKGGLGLLGICAAAYGIFRIAAFHPASRPEYLAWLKTTPWQPGIPLPIGPLHLILQDLVTVGILEAASLLFDKGSPLLIVRVFLISYFLTQQLLFTLCCAPVHAYWMTVILGGVFLFWNHILIQLILLALLYVIALRGQRVSLEQMDDWDAKFLEKQLRLSNDVASFQKPVWGWPHDCLSPQRAKFVSSRVTSVAVSVLIGWWSFVFLTLASRQTRELSPLEFGPAVAFSGMVLAAIRLYRYLANIRPPISLPGRLMTFRWIIPGFDLVFAGPLVIVGTGIILILLSIMDFIPALLSYPIAITLQLLTFFEFPPTLDQWRLTGNHRLAPPIASNTKELQITQ